MRGDYSENRSFVPPLNPNYKPLTLPPDPELRLHIINTLVGPTVKVKSVEPLDQDKPLEGWFHHTKPNGEADPNYTLILPHDNLFYSRPSDAFQMRLPNEMIVTAVSRPCSSIRALDTDVTKIQSRPLE